MKRLPSRSLKIAAAGAAAVVLGAGGGVAAYEVASGTATQTVVRQVTVTDSQPAANSSALSVSALYDRVHQGVVTIKVTTSQGQALGSGFVIDGEGSIRWSYVSPIGVNPGADGILTALEALSPQEAASR